MVAITTPQGGGGCLPTPRGDRRAYIYGETIPLHVVGGVWVCGLGCGGARVWRARLPAGLCVVCVGFVCVLCVALGWGGGYWGVLFVVWGLQCVTGCV